MRLKFLTRNVQKLSTLMVVKLEKSNKITTFIKNHEFLVALKQ